jgi:peroxiredoxin
VIDEVDAVGAQLLAVSPDSAARSQQIARQFRRNYRFLADPDLAVTRRYGLLHAAGGPGGEDVPRPSTVVIDRDGVVRWLSVTDNYQIRPDARDVVRALRACCAGPA